MAVRVKTLGDDHRNALLLYFNLGRILYRKPGASRKERVEAVSSLANVLKRANRVFGEHHPLTPLIAENLVKARSRLARDFPEKP